MTDRAGWIETAREAMQGADAPDARALAILEAASHLSPFAQTRDEMQSLVRLTRAALLMAGAPAADPREEEIFTGATAAWSAFESAWAVPGFADARRIVDSAGGSVEPGARSNANGTSTNG